MDGLIRSLALFFLRLGGFGLLLLGVLDSSFLFMPLGNDLLVIALTARHHDRMPYYAAMASAGSVLGVFFTDWVSRKGGQKGLEQYGKGRQMRYVEKKLSDHGGVALAGASLMPPPFPFTLFVIVAAALQYPRKKLLAIIGGTRVLRFSIDGLLAIVYGRGIIRVARSSGFQTFMIALVLISVAGSAYSIFNWIRKSRTRPAHAVS